MKVLVLAGGTSTERDISIVTGLGVAKALRNKGHKVYLADVFFGCSDNEMADAFTEYQDLEAAAGWMKGMTEKVEETRKSGRGFFGKNIIELAKESDKVFMALHGVPGEDGTVQAVFDLYGIAYTGAGHKSSAIAMDKGLTKELFSFNGIPVPNGVTLKRDDADKSLEKAGLELPVIIKPSCGGSSVGVTIANTREEYEKALETAFSYEPTAQVEGFIRGREFSVGVVDGKAYPVIEICPKQGFYDYTNKYKEGATNEFCPADIPTDKSEEMQRYALAAAKALRISSYCRMDFMMDGEGNIFCLEANTLPGMTPTSLLPQEAAAVGTGFDELCELLLNI